MTSGAHADEIDRIIRERLVVSRYESIVDLHSFRVTGYEALSRGPQGSTLEYPARLFPAARSSGRADELDELCLMTAVASFSALGGGEQVLCVNAEPSIAKASLAAAVDACPPNTQLMFEIPERAVGQSPGIDSGVARALRKTRAGLSVDDLSDPKTVPFLARLRPMVIKLEMRLIHDGPSAPGARVMTALGPILKSNDVWVVAKGIETQEHLAYARALGATHGQG